MHMQTAFSELVVIHNLSNMADGDIRIFATLGSTGAKCGLNFPSNIASTSTEVWMIKVVIK